MARTFVQKKEGGGRRFTTGPTAERKFRRQEKRAARVKAIAEAETPAAQPVPSRTRIAPETKTEQVERLIKERAAARRPTQQGLTRVTTQRAEAPSTAPRIQALADGEVTADVDTTQFILSPQESVRGTGQVFQTVPKATVPRDIITTSKTREEREERARIARATQPIDFASDIRVTPEARREQFGEVGGRLQQFSSESARAALFPEEVLFSIPREGVPVDVLFEADPVELAAKGAGVAAFVASMFVGGAVIGRGATAVKSAFGRVTGTTPKIVSGVGTGEVFIQEGAKRGVGFGKVQTQVGGKTFVTEIENIFKETGRGVTRAGERAATFDSVSKLVTTRQGAARPTARAVGVSKGVAVETSEARGKQAVAGFLIEKGKARPQVSLSVSERIGEELFAPGVIRATPKGVTPVIGREEFLSLSKTFQKDGVTQILGKTNVFTTPKAGPVRFKPPTTQPPKASAPVLDFEAALLQGERVARESIKAAPKTAGPVIDAIAAATTPTTTRVVTAASKDAIAQDTLQFENNFLVFPSRIAPMKQKVKEPPTLFDTAFDTKSIQDQVSKTIIGTRPATRTVRRQGTRTAQQQRPRTAQQQQTRELVIADLSLSRVPRTVTQDLLLGSRTSQQQRTAGASILDTPFVSQVRVPGPVGGLLFGGLVLPGSSGRKSVSRGARTQPGYDAFSLVGGIERKLTQRPRTRESALSVGARFVDNSPSASFDIRLSGAKAQGPEDMLWGSVKHKFRKRKTKNALELVEKDAFRIDSFGEIFGLAVAPRRKKKKK